MSAMGNNDISLADLTADPAMMSLLSSANESELQDLLGDLDFNMLDAASAAATGPLVTSSPARENGLLGGGLGGVVPGGAAAGALLGVSPVQKPGQAGRAGQGAAGLGGVGGRLLSPPPLPAGLPAPLIKRIEDLRAVSLFF